MSNDLDRVGPAPWATRLSSRVSARSAVGALFFLNGVLLASWASEIPSISHTLQLPVGLLALALFGLPLGSVAVLPLITVGLRTLGARGVGVAGALLAALMLVLAALMLVLAAQMPGLVGLSVVLLGFGAGSAALDVAMNAAGLNLEARSGCSLLSGLHGMFSAGALIGALVGSGLIALGVTAGAHFLGVGVLGVLIALVCLPGLPPTLSSQEARSEGAAKPVRFGWGLGAVALLAFSAALGEGATLDWSGVYLRDTVRSSAPQAALGFACFSLAMLLTRLVGDRLTDRFGAAVLGRGAGLLAACGLGLTLTAPQLLPALAGFTLLGVGLAVLVPLAFSAVAQVAPERTVAGLTLVTAAFQLGYLAGPPLIGGLAALFSLRTALILVPALCLLASVLAGRLRGTQREPLPA